MKRNPPHERQVKDPATRCRELRKRKGMTQLELADEAGVSVGLIHRLEIGEQSLSKTWVCSLIAVADALGVAPYTLYPRLRRTE